MTDNIFFGKNIYKAMAVFTFPVLLSLFLQALYGAVDLWAVGKFATFEDISAVAIGSEFMMVITQFISGFLTSTTVLLASSVGSSDKDGERDVVKASVKLYTFMGVLFSVVIVSFAPFFSSIMNTPPESKTQTITYLRVSGFGTLFIVYYNLISALFRALGDSKSPFVFVSIAAIVNIIGDVLLTKVIHLGTLGVAISTIVSQFISVVVSFFFLRKKLENISSENRANSNEKKNVYKELIKIGLPVGLVSSLTELSYAIVISFANTLGVVASAGVGVATKVIMFIYLVPTAFLQTVSVFVSGNIGKGEYKRAKQSMWSGALYAVSIGFVAAVVLIFFGDKVSLIFTNDLVVAQYSHDYLKVCAIECFLLSFVYCLLGFFNGSARTKFVAIEGLLAIFLVKIPYAYYATFIASPTIMNIAASDALSSIFQFIICIIYYLCVKDKSVL